MGVRASQKQTWVERLVGEIFFRCMRGAAQVLAALPSRWVLTFADRIGDLVYVIDARGRRVGRQNLAVVFGDRYSSRERKRIIRTSMRESARALAVVLHAAPLTPKRVAKWVDVPASIAATFRSPEYADKGAVIVSAHLGNWEILLGLGSLVPEKPLKFLVEASVHPAIDRMLAYVRGSGGGKSEQRQGGARALNSHLRRGGLAGLVVDRNARRERGGIWVPFCGLQARTTPLPALMARRNDAPIAPVFALPLPNGRYRIHLGPEVSLDVRTDDPRDDVLEITTRLNRLVEDMIRRYPEAWNWTQKRFKSRPEREQGAYPAYSFWDPDLGTSD